MFCNVLLLSFTFASLPENQVSLSMMVFLNDAPISSSNVPLEHQICFLSLSGVIFFRGRKVETTIFKIQ